MHGDLYSLVKGRDQHSILSWSNLPALVAGSSEFLRIKIHPFLIFHFKCHQQFEDFESVSSAVPIVSQKTTCFPGRQRNCHQEIFFCTASMSIPTVNHCHGYSPVDLMCVFQNPYLLLFFGGTHCAEYRAIFSLRASVLRSIHSLSVKDINFETSVGGFINRFFLPSK